jgi:hypothetical protein
MSTQTHSQTDRSCNALGVCQARKSPCNGCNLRLAPGTIHGPFKRARFVWLRRNWPVCIVVAGALLAWLALQCLAWALALALVYWGHSYG